MSDSAEKIREAVNKVADEERRKFGPEPKPDGESKTGQISRADVLRALERNEDGDAEIFVQLHRGRICYDHSAGAWYVWTGHYWTADKKEDALAGVADVAKSYENEERLQLWEQVKAKQTGNDDTATKKEKILKILHNRIKELRTLRRKKNVVHLAHAGGKSLGISGDEWDKKPMTLPVSNGVIDLKTGKLSDGRPDDYLRAVAPTEWQGLNAPCPTWENFLKTTFAADEELITFMARLCGYAITGTTSDAVLPIFWGEGRNGKTVLLQALADVLGPTLSGPLESEFLLETKFTRASGGPSSDKLYLRARRLTWLSETSENRSLNAGKVKLLTGGDQITGRAPYAKQQITFTPTHKIFLLTNHKPKADAYDEALWRRILLVPFQMAFVPKPDDAKAKERLADPNLPEKLRAEKSGILGWLVRGCLAWQKEGLNPPESLLSSTKEYQDSEDAIKIFITEKCITGPESRVRAEPLYLAFKALQESNGEKAMTATKFGRCISKAYDSQKDRTGKVYIGITLAGSG